MIEPKEGSQYITRSGEPVVLLKFISNDTYPCLVIDSKKRMYNCDRNGAYIGKGFPHKKDLLKERFNEF
jgi:hypothetical protein